LYVLELFFCLPSLNSVTEQCRQGVQPRAKSGLDIKVSLWSFSDNARFKNNILTCPASAINQSMEEYAHTMLLLFHRYHSHKDLHPSVTAGSFPYVTKLPEIYEHEVLLESVPKYVFTERNLTFLQNIQNCAHNSLRYKVGKDDLQSVTECFRPEQEFEDEEDVPYELFMEYVDETAQDDRDPLLFHRNPSDYSFQPIRNHGLNGCGCKNKIPESVVEYSLEDENDAWVDVEQVQFSSQINTSTSVTEISEWKVMDIVKLLLRTAGRNLLEMPSFICPDSELSCMVCQRRQCDSTTTVLELFFCLLFFDLSSLISKFVPLPRLILRSLC
jgi:hypothetical protein